MIAGAITAGSARPIETKVCCRNIAPRASKRWFTWRVTSFVPHFHRSNECIPESIQTVLKSLPEIEKINSHVTRVLCQCSIPQADNRHCILFGGSLPGFLIQHYPRQESARG